MLNRLDAKSRTHLQTFARQVALLALIGTPLLLIDRHPPVLYLLQLRTMFGLSALVILAVGMFSRQPWSHNGFCIWDHFLALVLLKFGCSVALWLLG